MLHHDLVLLQTNFCTQAGLNFSQPVIEKESSEYSGYSFHINSALIQFRVGKITPIKVGFFVTFYKRLSTGNIAPYAVEDNIDYFIISVRESSTQGFFIFPKHILLKYNIISKNNLGGKNGFRLYTPSNVTTNTQAKKTQQWQKEYFFTTANTSFSAFFIP